MEQATSYIAKLKQKIYDIYNRTLASFITGLFSSPVSILFLGIDNAGKTTLLNLLKNETTSATRPTNHPTTTDIDIGNMSANIFDLGGHEPARMIWQNYFYGCNGIVFIIDARDNERCELVREAYNSVQQNMRKANKGNVPICVLVNKMDKVYHWLDGDVNKTENYIQDLLNEIGIEESENVKVSCVTMIRDETSKKHDQGIYDAFAWLENAITQSKKIKSKNYL